MAFVFIAAGGALAAYSSLFAAQYATFIGGILAATGVYLTGNVATDFLTNKSKAIVEVAHINKTGTTVEAAKGKDCGPVTPDSQPEPEMENK